MPSRTDRRHIVLVYTVKPPQEGMTSAHVFLGVETVQFMPFPGM